MLEDRSSRIVPDAARWACQALCLQQGRRTEPPWQGGQFKGELNPEMKLSQSIELFVTKRLPPIRSLSDVWFSSCASWKSAATPPQFGRDTPFWRHWHSDWPGGDRGKVVFRTFRKISAFSSRVVPTGFCRTILRVECWLLKAVALLHRRLATILLPFFFCFAK